MIDFKVRSSLAVRVTGVATMVGTVSLWVACGSGTPDVRGKELGGVGGGISGTTGATDGGDMGGSGPAFVSSSTTGTFTINPIEDASVDACEADISQAEQVGLDMYIVFDRSGSMADIPGAGMGPQNQVRWPDPDGFLGDCPVDGDTTTPAEQDSKWCLATNALADFFTQPTMEDVRAALQFMTPADPENYDVCGPEANNLHATAAVNLTQLPVPATDSLVTSLENEYPNAEDVNGLSGPDVGTRIEAALHGIAAFTTANADPMRKTIGVLITDGDPYNCNENENDLAQIAADHFAATGIATFIIGMTGASADTLETIAATAGGPEHGPDFCDADAGDTTCHYWSVGDGNSAAFTEALAQIQESVFISCEYQVPIPQTGDKLDPELVQVTFDDGMGNVAPVGKVADATACDTAGTGWYYDNPTTPTSILLCPTNCSTVTDAPSGARVEILYGCSPGIF